MATAAVLSGPSTPARFTYIEWQELFAREKPVQVLDAHKAAPDQKASTITFHDNIVEEVQDVRGYESSFSIDVQGFEYIKHASAVKPAQFQEKTFVDEHYLPECEELLKARFEGVDKIHFLHWRVCKSSLQLLGSGLLARKS